MIKIMPKIIVLPELFASGGEYSFSEITAKTGLTRSNVSHLLQALCEEQMLEKVQYGKYRRGNRLTRLGLSVNPWKELIDKAGRCADNLMLWLNELAVVGMRDQERRLTLVKRKPVKALQVEQENGKLYPADWYSTANGRVLLAFAPPSTVRRIVRRYGLPDRDVWRVDATLPKLEKQLTAIRKQEFVSMDVDDLIHALGVPVRDAAGDAVMSLATAYPVFTCRKSESEILNRMKELAAELEEELKIGDIRIVELKNGPFGKSE